VPATVNARPPSPSRLRLHVDPLLRSSPNERGPCHYQGVPALETPRVPVPRPRTGSPGKVPRGQGRAGTSRALVVLALLVTPLLAARASAEPAPFVALDYDVPTDQRACPDALEFRANIQVQLGYDPFQPGGDRRVSVQITHKGSGLEGRIRWSDANGRWVGDRRLASRRADCAELATNLAFAVAVQVQLLATLTFPADIKDATTTGGSPPAPAPTAASEVSPGSTPGAGTAASSTGERRTAAPATPPPETVPRVEPAAGERATGSRPDEPPNVEVGGTARRTDGNATVALSVGVGPAMAIGLAPHATALGRMFVGGRIDHFSLEVGVDATWPIEQRNVDAAGFSLERLGASLAACGHARAFAACGLGAVGSLRVSGLGLDQPASPTGTFSQLGARILARHDFDTGLFVAAHMDALVLLSRWTVRVNDVDTWMTPRMGGVVGVDVGVGFF
jgi:hypothetical protein